MRRRAAGLALGLIVCLPAAARAQAYLDKPNTLSANLSYTFSPSGQIVMSSTGHDLPVVAEVPNVVVFAHTFTLASQYVTPVDGLAVDAQLSMVGSQLRDGSFEHAPAPGPYDDGDTHFTLTDFRGGLRYQVKAIEELLGLSFAAATTIPVTDYPTAGFAYPSQHLMALHLGTAVARTLDPLVPDLYFQLQYEYSIREKVDDTPATEQFSHNTSDVNFVLGYLLPADFNVAAGADLKVSHGGVTFAEFIFQDPSVQAAHDRLLNEDFVLAGGNVGYEISDSISAGLAARFFVWGKNTRNQNLFSVDLEYRFF